MLSKIKKISIVLLIVLSCVLMYRVGIDKRVGTDTGFDTSYDSGGSSWGGSSSHDYSSSGSGDSNPGGIVATVDFIILWGLVIVSAIALEKTSKVLKILYWILSISSWIGLHFLLDIIFDTEVFVQGLIEISIIVGALIVFILFAEIGDRIEKKKKKKNLKLKENMTLEKLHEYLPDTDIDLLLKEMYTVYLQLQNAWMNFDYDKMRDNTTDELYNQYEMQLKTLEVKNQKNVMTDFNFVNGTITDIDNNKDALSITTEMEIEFFDYIVDKDNKVVRGNKNRKVTMHYKMIFKKGTPKHKFCTNCGAKIKESASVKCESCGTIINQESSKWVLSKKEALAQI